MSDFETLTSNNKIKKALLSLGCSSPSSAAASAPSSSSSAADVRPSPEWNQGKRSTRTGKIKQQQQQKSGNKKKERMEFSDDSMDFVARHHAMMMTTMDRRGGGRHDAERIHREIMMFQTRMMSGRMNSYDRYRDWRLDVDRMSYEELLELGDRIGYVNTGLREDDISHSITKVKLSALDTSRKHFSTEMEKKCSICQEEYEVNEEIGKLECGHGYHMYCIKQWLLQKNACPVCKTAVSNT